ncbi:guanylate cyclase [Verrucomicrobiota bacterium]|nr:guanylate cyclase [Verrucomicrobiota bacterium]
MFCFGKVKFAPHKLTPLLLSLTVVAVVTLVQFLPRWFPGFDVAQRLEWITYDWRVRQAFGHPAPVATNLAAIFIDNDSLKVFNEKFRYSWPWPRHLHGRLVRELALEGAQVIGFDIFFIELQPDFTETRVLVPGKGRVSSDDYLAAQIKAAGNVILGAPGETSADQWRLLPPADLFRTNALVLAHATSDRDSDGVLRRAKAFKDDPQAGRVWHLGLRMAAQSLGLDLEAATVEKGRIILRGKGGVERIIPVDDQGYFHIDWHIAWNDKRLFKASFEDVIELEESRAGGTAIEPALTDKLVFIGSIGSGNNISDVGASPLEKETYLLSKHWNVANSLLTGRFIRRSSALTEWLAILVLAGLSFFVTSRLRAPWATVAVLGAAAAWVVVATLWFVRERYWLPIVLPVGGGLLLNHASLVTYQLLFEEREKRRVKDVFSKLVSPNVVNELLSTEKLNLNGSLRDITVFFADVRGFTELTDTNASKADAYVKQQQLTGAAADAYYDQQARETLETVNTYLATIADQIKKHAGTLDKYIGDCVMAFWGAPTPNPQHALSCVRAAVDTQRSLYALNVRRAEENKRREAANPARVAAGQQPLPPLPLLSLGTGINSGTCIVGLMGSDDTILNYTVFGREVNLASRLEGVSGRGRIIIGEATYRGVLRDDPALGAKCVELPPVAVKGFKGQVRIYEVPWKETPPATAAPAATAAAGAPAPVPAPVPAPAPATAPAAPPPAALTPGSAG